jgi:hypothetical protein
MRQLIILILANFFPSTYNFFPFPPPITISLPLGEGWGEVFKNGGLSSRTSRRNFFSINFNLLRHPMHPHGL